jgi:hypothetical protein
MTRKKGRDDNKRRLGLTRKESLGRRERKAGMTRKKGRDDKKERPG